MGTQITVLRLHDSVTLEHEFFAEGQHFKEILKEIGVQPGFSRGFWGLEGHRELLLRQSHVLVFWVARASRRRPERVMATRVRQVFRIRPPATEELHSATKPLVTTLW